MATVTRRYDYVCWDKADVQSATDPTLMGSSGCLIKVDVMYDDTITDAAAVDARMALVGAKPEAVPTTGSPFMQISEGASDPDPVANKVLLYAKDVSGVSDLFARCDNGSVFSLTKAQYSPPEKWTQSLIAAGQTDVALACLVSTHFNTIKADKAGSIVRLSTRLTEAITDANAGSAIVKVTVNGIPGTLAVSHSSGTNPSGGQASQASGVDTYNAGDLLGIQITTLATFAPVTANLEAWMVVEE